MTNESGIEQIACAVADAHKRLGLSFREMAKAAVSAIREDHYVIPKDALVKPLVWEEDISEFLFTSCGTYASYELNNGKWLLSNGDVDIGKFDSDLLAKEAAQEHHDECTIARLNIGDQT